MGERTLICSSDEELAKHLASRSHNLSVIGIDGWTGVGKTRLANRLAERLSGHTLDLDAFLDRDQKCFIGALRLGELSKALESGGRPLFISGICLRDALARVECEVDFNIYIKRMAAWGWADEDELGSDPVPEVDPSGGGAMLRREMRAYHERWNPHSSADCEFHWSEAC